MKLIMENISLLLCTFMLSIFTLNIAQAERDANSHKLRIADFTNIFTPQALFESFDKSSYSLRYRNETVDEDQVKDLFQYRFRLKFQMTLLENAQGDPKLVVKMVAPSTGQKFGSGWDSTEEFNPHIRKFYLTWHGDGYQLQGGTMEVLPDGFMSTLADIDHDGAIRGVRLALDGLLKDLNLAGRRIEKVAVTIGRIDDEHLDRVMFDQNWEGSPNFYEIKLQGNISLDSRYVATYQHFNGTKYTDNSLDLGFEIDPRMTFLSFVDQIKFGSRLHSGGDSSVQRVYTSFSKDLLWNVKSNLSLVYVNDCDTQYPLEDYWICSKQDNKGSLNIGAALKTTLLQGSNWKLDWTPIKARYAIRQKNLRLESVLNIGLRSSKNASSGTLSNTVEYVKNKENEWRIEQQRIWNKRWNKLNYDSIVFDGE